MEQQLNKLQNEKRVSDENLNGIVKEMQKEAVGSKSLLIAELEAKVLQLEYEQK